MIMIQRTKFYGKRSIDEIMAGQELGTIFIYKSKTDKEEYVPIYHGAKTNQWFCAIVKYSKSKKTKRLKADNKLWFSGKFLKKLPDEVYKGLEMQLKFYEHPEQFSVDDIKLTT
jgi:hypothetical protein